MNTRENKFLVPYISTDRNYWLVRTEGGKYYESFYHNKYIAIDWNDLDEQFFNTTRYQSIDYNIEPIITKELLMNFYEQKFSGNKDKVKQYVRKYQRIATMVNRFAFGMKKGDIVLVPSTDSDQISFGEILDDQQYFEDNFPETTPQERDSPKFCPFVKRRTVRWLKTVNKRDLDSNLYSLLYSQHVINLISKREYAHFIDRTLDSIYIKGDTAHLILNVKQKGDINALSFADMIKDSVKIINDFSQQYPSVKEINGNKIKIKANVQSPGPIELFGSIKEVLLLTSLVVDIYGLNINTYKVISFWKKENHDEVQQALEILESEEFEEYRKSVLSSKTRVNNLKEHLNELGVEPPTKDVNSSKGIQGHRGVIDYDLTS